MDCIPRKIGISTSKSIPLLSVEYLDGTFSARCRTIKLRDFDERTDSDLYAQRLQTAHPKIFKKISLSQISKLLEKAIKSIRLRKDEKENPIIQRPSSSIIPALNERDLNKASDAEVRAAKMAMDVDFQKNALKPGDKGYVYDVQVQFKATEKSEWDSEEEEEEEEEEEPEEGIDEDLDDEF